MMRGAVVAIKLFLFFVTITVVQIRSQESLDHEIGTIEDEAFRETIDEGRGERDIRGVREEWESSQHVGKNSKTDTRRPISSKVKRLLENYGLECNGCDHNEATSVINNFVRNTKEEAKIEAERRARNERYFSFVVSGLAFFGVVSYLIFRFRPFKEADNAASSSVGNHLRSSIQSIQEKAAAEERFKRAKAADARADARQAKSSWLELEEKALWTARQEKQFTKALNEFSGIRPKERYQLIAGRVHDKSRLECLMHHKLQQLKAKEHTE